ncbi:HNH endonuclease [Acidovorax carolinensis]|uniref:HNH endonuclease n=1 Tax=Acidovorax carolinensis TaxID=553814 RepID=UPI000B349186|nr:HNH endonuclease [Acidovorax carolinensis]ART48740.1 restriction endonuclease [Acidovorax carolinensis]
MHPLQRALIEKAGHDNGFEYVLPGNAEHAALASARHPARVRVAVVEQGYEVGIDTGSATLAQEVARTFAANQMDATTFVLPSEALLAHWLRRAAALSQALPNQAVRAFEQQVQAELAELAPDAAHNTEVLRMVRQRVGQQAYRQAMLDYWGGACAVTGLALAPVLRASHAKPWAVCDSDAERLDVFNGMLLAAHLDALFDQFLLSFDEHGRVLISPQLDAAACEVLGLRPTMQMCWMAPEHQPYLSYHRQRFMAGH